MSDSATGRRTCMGVRPLHLGIEIKLNPHIRPAFDNPKSQMSESIKRISINSKIPSITATYERNRSSEPAAVVNPGGGPGTQRLNR